MVSKHCKGCLMLCIPRNWVDTCWNIWSHQPLSTEQGNLSSIGTTLLAMICYASIAPVSRALYTTWVQGLCQTGPTGAPYKKIPFQSRFANFAKSIWLTHASVEPSQWCLIYVPFFQTVDRYGFSHFGVEAQHSRSASVPSRTCPALCSNFRNQQDPCFPWKHHQLTL